jgi:mRNA-degrading endonuclease toxin of MazEF toxin-antitoxin module
MSSAPPLLPKPRQGEIWFTRIPTDPPDYFARPVVIVSLDARNQNERANTVLVVPLSTTIKNPMPPTNLRLSPGETGLREIGELQASGITTISKRQLKRPREKLRQLNRCQIKLIAQLVGLAMGILPEELAE